VKDIVCAIDIGTSRIKVALIDSEGKIETLSTEPVPGETQGDMAFYFDPEAYFLEICNLIRRTFEKSKEKNVIALCITNQRATIIPAGKDGYAVGPALSWQDTRCGTEVEKFMQIFDAKNFRKITGLPPSTLWSLGKILWLKEKEPHCFKSASKFVLLHDYILHRMGTEDFITDFSNASLTGLLDLQKLSWSDEILNVAGIKSSNLSNIIPAGTRTGMLNSNIAEKTGLKQGIPLITGGGDQQCATLGAGVIKKGQASLCLGTAAVLSCPVTSPIIDTERHLFCTCHVIPGFWVIEGIHNTFGSSISWSGNIAGITSQEEWKNITGNISLGEGKIFFLPFLDGIGSPDFDSLTKGAFLNLSLSHSRSDIIRSVMEGIVMELRRIIDEIDSYVKIRELIITGGYSGENIMNQFLADITGRPILLSRNMEDTLSGTGILAWKGLGIDIKERFTINEMECIYPSKSEYLENLYRLYCERVKIIRDMNRVDQREVN